MTLIELIVSIIIISTGVLGLASTAAVVLRQMSGAQMQTLVSRTASSRFEQMRSSGTCTALASGTATGPLGITETWTVAQMTRTVAVRDSVTYLVRGEERFQVFVTLIPCTAST